MAEGTAPPDLLATDHLLGMHLDGYGCAGTNAVAYGLACMELEAGDSAPDARTGPHRRQTTISSKDGSTRAMSSGSDVATACRCSRACKATCTSTTSAWPDIPHNWPTARAVSSS